MTKIVPGGPFSAERQATPEVIAQLNAYYGLDKPVWQQYLGYLSKVVRFDFGPSYTYQSESVNEVIGRAFPISLQIGTLAFCIALVIGATAGLIEAPVSGWYGLNYVPLHPAVMPAVTLGLFYAAYIARLTRGGMLDILNQDFIRTARAKGVPEHEIILRHALRGGLLPVVAFLGPCFAGLISGSFVVEKVFNVPGLGQEFIKSVFNRDYPLILGTVVFFGALIVIFNLVSDVVQLLLDPRSRN